MRTEREKLEDWRIQLENWRIQLDKERASFDGARTTLDIERSEIAIVRGGLADEIRTARRRGDEIVTEARADAHAIVERAWLEAERLVGEKEVSDDDEALMAQLRDTLETRESELESRAHELTEREGVITEAELAFGGRTVGVRRRKDRGPAQAHESGYEQGWSEAAAAASETAVTQVGPDAETP